jgi:hypothetical protein
MQNSAGIFPWTLHAIQAATQLWGGSIALQKAVEPEFRSELETCDESHERRPVAKFARAVKLSRVRVASLLYCDLIFLLAFPGSLSAARVLVIGDSLSAEYDALPDLPGIENPTEYARITVPGWEAMSWVEVLGKLRRDAVDFGRYRTNLPGWPDLRFTGYEFNFAIPGFTASQYAELMESSIFSNPQLWPTRLGLEDSLGTEAEWIVVALGGNEFRSQYGFLYEGGDPTKLINNLKRDLEIVLAFVREQNRRAPLIVLNIPDLGATPSKKSAHPDPAKRARASAATATANAMIAALMPKYEAVLADLFAETRKLIEGQPTLLGAVELIDDREADNDPRFLFTREGLHPNTGLQLIVARLIIQTLNVGYQLAVPEISDGEALAFLGLNPDQPYWDWVATFALPSAAMAADPDADGLANLVEYAFGLNPRVPDSLPARWVHSSGQLIGSFRPDPQRERHVCIEAQWSADLHQWQDLFVQRSTDPGWFTVTIPTTAERGFIQLLAKTR